MPGSSPRPAAAAQANYFKTPCTHKWTHYDVVRLPLDILMFEQNVKRRTTSIQSKWTSQAYGNRGNGSTRVWTRMETQAENDRRPGLASFALN
jgi:hypothetical protein